MEATLNHPKCISPHPVTLLLDLRPIRADVVEGQINHIGQHLIFGMWKDFKPWLALVSESI